MTNTTPIQNNGKRFQEIVNFLIKDVDNPSKKDEVDESIMELKRIVDSLPTSNNGFPLFPGDTLIDHRNTLKWNASLFKFTYEGMPPAPVHPEEELIEAALSGTRMSTYNGMYPATDYDLKLA